MKNNNIVDRSFKEGECEDVSILDNRHQVSLFVEYTK